VVLKIWVPATLAVSLKLFRYTWLPLLALSIFSPIRLFAVVLPVMTLLRLLYRLMPLVVDPVTLLSRSILPLVDWR
jgi:hypothetical protein